MKNKYPYLIQFRKSLKTKKGIKQELWVFQALVITCHRPILYIQNFCFTYIIP